MDEVFSWLREVSLTTLLDVEKLTFRHSFECRKTVLFDIELQKDILLERVLSGSALNRASEPVQ